MRHRLVGAFMVAMLVSGCAASSSASSGQASTPTQAASSTPARPSSTASGAASQLPALQLVAIGDSIAASKLCQCPRYPDVYSQLAAEALGQPVRVQNMAVNGATSADLLYRLTNMRPLQTAIGEADLITMSIGFNDIGSCTTGTDRKCYETAIAGLKTNLETILTDIDGRQEGHPHILRATAYYNFFAGRTDGDQSDPKFQAFYAKQLASLNAIICAAVAAHDGVCVDLLKPFNGPAGDQDAAPFLANDHVHPGTKGHEVIAQAIADAGYAPIRP